MLLNSNDSLINGNQINRVGGTGILVMGVAMTQISNNQLDEIRGTHANGITSYLANRDTLVANNTVTNSNIALTYHGGSSGPQTNLTIYNNIFEIEFSGGFATNSWGQNMVGVSIINNIFISSGNKFGLSPHPSDQNVTIKNNIIH